MGHYLKRQFVRVQQDHRPTRNNQLFGSSLTKEIIIAYSDNMQNDLWIKHLSEYKFIFEDNLG